MRCIVRVRDDQAVSPVIAEILLVAITVTIAGVVYFAASSFTMQATVTGRPFVALMPASLHDGIATITVAGVSRAASAASYRVNLQVDGTLAQSVALPAAGTAAILTVHDADYRVSWSDLGGTGTLSGGDPIQVRAAEGPLPVATSFTFYLIWSDGSVLQTISWTT